MKVLIIIPARGGSKGIPRKNLRSLANKPLIYYSINKALKVSNADVFVSTEDTEIKLMAESFGANVIERGIDLSLDNVTLDAVIYDAYQKVEQIGKCTYDLIITIQPTSPLIKTQTIIKAIKIFEDNPKVDTVISVTDDRHLSWTLRNNVPTPLYRKRLNRQYLPAQFKETGGILATRPRSITEKSRIGKNIHLLEVSEKESIDIDTLKDWAICAFYLSHKKVLFVVSGYKKIGLGHVYNTLSIANEILEHEVLFLVDRKSELAKDVISSFNYPVHFQSNEDINDDIFALAPDVVINDRLDTNRDQILPLKEKGFCVINFEDLGEGARYADIVINAMYPEKEMLVNHYFGQKYFCLRDEFLLKNKVVEIRKKVGNVLLSFGGADPANLTKRVLNIISPYCINHDIKITVILGKGYKENESLEEYQNTVSILQNVHNISQYMINSDIAFTSAGRTTFEVATLGLPSIILCQNQRETTHFFASQEFGFLNLGLQDYVGDEEILSSFQSIVEDKEKRAYMAQLMLKADVKKGKERVLKIIAEAIANNLE